MAYGWHDYISTTKNNACDRKVTQLLQEAKASEKAPLLDLAIDISKGNLSNGESSERVKGISKLIPYSKLKDTVPQYPQLRLEFKPASYVTGTGIVKEDALPHLKEASIDKKLGDKIDFFCCKPAQLYEDLKVAKSGASDPVPYMKDYVSRYGIGIRFRNEPVQCFLHDLQGVKKETDLLKIKSILTASLDFDYTPSIPSSPTTRFLQTAGAD